MLPHREEHCGYFQRGLIKDCNELFNFFNNRIVNVWNSLPDKIVRTVTTNVATVSHLTLETWLESTALGAIQLLQ